MKVLLVWQSHKWLIWRSRLIDTSKSVKTVTYNWVDMMSVTTAGHWHPCMHTVNDNDISWATYQTRYLYCTHPAGGVSSTMSTKAMMSPVLVHLLVTTTTSVVSWPLLFPSPPLPVLPLWWPNMSIMPIWWWSRLSIVPVQGTRLSIVPIWRTILSIVPVWRGTSLKEMVLICWMLTGVGVHVQRSSVSVRSGAASAHTSCISLLTCSKHK